MGITRVKGSAWDTTGNIVVDLIAELSKVNREGICYVSGFSHVNDGAGGWYKYEIATPRSLANGTNIVDPTGTGNGRGCWVRQNFISSGLGRTFNEVQTSVTAQQDFMLKKFTYDPNQNTLSVYVNGTRLTRYAFTETSPTQVHINNPLRNGDVVEFIFNEQYSGSSANAVQADDVVFNPAATGMVALNVQAAIEELEVSLASGGGGGGALINAALIPYLPIAPDVSANVQAALHWIQNGLNDHIIDPVAAHKAAAILYENAVSGLTANDVQHALDEITSKLGSGNAIDINFDPTTNRLVSDNVQAAFEELLLLFDGDLQALTDHINDPHAAHNATAIKFVSATPRFANRHNVTEAVEKLSGDLDAHKHTALDVAYDDSGNGIGANLQLAVTRNFYVVDDHINHASYPHAADHISFPATPTLPVANVEEAVLAVEQEIIVHKSPTTSAHLAVNIVFQPTRGLVANNVQAAIELALSGGKVYRGHMDLTQPPVIPVAPDDWKNGEYYSVVFNPVPGAVNTIDAGWQPHFAHPLPPALLVNGTMTYDGTAFWLAAESNMNAVVTNPPPGFAQTITTEAPNDPALVLAGIVGQVADLLQIMGNAKVTGTLNAKLVQDEFGTVRQLAIAVPFDAATTGLTGINVQTALEEAYDMAASHIDGTGTKHNANAIVLAPIPGVTGNEVQTGLTSVQGNLTDHIASHGAHSAAHLLFDNSINGFIAINIQEAIEENKTRGSDHAAEPIGAHAASAISYDPTASGLVAVNVKTVLDEIALAFNTHTLVDNVARHTARSIKYSPTAPDTSSDVQTALARAAGLVDVHVAKPLGAHAASAISFDKGTSSLISNDVQTAIIEIDTLTQIIDAGTY